MRFSLVQTKQQGNGHIELSFPHCDTWSSILPKVRLRPENDEYGTILTRRQGKQPSSRNGRRSDGTRRKSVLTGTQESDENESSEIPIETDKRDGIYSVAFHTHIVHGEDHGRVQRRGVEDGNGVGLPMDGGSVIVYDLTVSRA